jgi:Na+/phosphate symporter
MLFLFSFKGANIGTSVTSTLVAFAQVADQEKFRRSFAAATVIFIIRII